MVHGARHVNVNDVISVHNPCQLSQSKVLENELYLHHEFIW